jgi:hypothetical protein
MKQTIYSTYGVLYYLVDDDHIHTYQTTGRKGQRILKQTK